MRGTRWKQKTYCTTRRNKGHTAGSKKLLPPARQRPYCRRIGRLGHLHLCWEHETRTKSKAHHARELQKTRRGSAKIYGEIQGASR